MNQCEQGETFINSTEYEKFIKREIVFDLILEMLYRGIELNDNDIVFDKYNLDNKQLLFLLKQYDNEKVEGIKQMLIAGKGE